MFRDQRLRDNWALIHAIHQANQREVPIAIAFNLFNQFKGAKARHFGFMLRGLKKLHSDLQSSLNVPFFLFRVSSILHVIFLNFYILMSDFTLFFIYFAWSAALVYTEYSLISVNDMFVLMIRFKGSLKLLIAIPECL